MFTESTLIEAYVTWTERTAQKARIKSQRGYVAQTQSPGKKYDLTKMARRVKNAGTVAKLVTSHESVPNHRSQDRR